MTSEVDVRCHRFSSITRYHQLLLLFLCSFVEIEYKGKLTYLLTYLLTYNWQMTMMRAEEWRLNWFCILQGCSVSLKSLDLEMVSRLFSTSRFRFILKRWRSESHLGFEAERHARRSLSHFQKSSADSGCLWNSKKSESKALALGIALLNEAQWRFTTVEVVSDWHWL